MAKEYTAEEVFDYFFDKYNNGDLEQTSEIASKKAQAYIKQHGMSVDEWNQFLDDNDLDESWKMND